MNAPKMAGSTLTSSATPHPAITTMNITFLLRLMMQRNICRNTWGINPPSVELRRQTRSSLLAVLTLALVLRLGEEPHQLLAQER